ncbi:conserved hypothetical protein [Xenorhabdus bovienii str. kraussei Quebec]|uniref:Uncharacterized protein n=1 Tax=Xenorhabdus bovienii str. kraussei Quebec TaxID=1398203 RepID=A0A077PB25_XENBV|nr:hypothetical protein [Xenorhabdus bovienii]CDH18148.1 conserved hypothetical protein [Xenorhabdus bovienii str. kraussei Quebec]
MKILKKERISGVISCDVRMSEKEMAMFLGCLNDILIHHSDEQLNEKIKYRNEDKISWYNDSFLEKLNWMKQDSA